MYMLTQIYQWTDRRWLVRCTECSDITAWWESADLATATARLAEHRRAAPDEHPVSLSQHAPVREFAVPPADGGHDLAGDVGDSWFRAPRSVASENGAPAVDGPGGVGAS